jgi:nitrite reductase/ring-hydroxylating ferredoxin subunit
MGAILYQPRFTEGSMKEINVGSAGTITEGRVQAAAADGQAVLLTRAGGKICAFSAKCPHIGLSLARGKIEAGTIRCPWHGSRFDLATGKNLDWANSVAGLPMPKWTHAMLALGKQPAPLKMYAAREAGGSVIVCMPET